MSDTPRTDAIYPPEMLDRGIAEHGRSWGWGVLSDMRNLARELECELADANRRIEDLTKEDNSAENRQRIAEDADFDRHADNKIT